jgi:hypothetical protein
LARRFCENTSICKRLERKRQAKKLEVFMLLFILLTLLLRQDAVQNRTTMLTCKNHY